ncbi:MAG: hypothetical protein ACOY3L_15285 [Pseudomonadota bacterium]
MTLRWGTACRRRAARFLGAGLTLGLAWLTALHAGGVRAEDNDVLPPPMLISLPPLDLPPSVDQRVDHVASASLLSDGRIAVLGSTAPAENGFLRIFDPKSGTEEDHYWVGNDGAGPTSASVETIGDAVFIFGTGGSLWRVSKQDVLVSDVDFGRDTAFGSTTVSGAMLVDGKSVLLSWWEATPSRNEFCGNGAVVARLSPEGKVIWRWQDRQGGFYFPNDMVVLADSTILVLVEGSPNEYMGTMWNPCVHGWEYLVALSPDGHEIARRTLPRRVWLGPLSLSWDGKEALGAVGSDIFVGAAEAIMRIRVESGRILWDRVNIAAKIDGLFYEETIVTSLEKGGYLAFPAHGPLAVKLDEGGEAARIYSRPVDLTGLCGVQLGRGVLCGSGDMFALLPLQ